MNARGDQKYRYCDRHMSYSVRMELNTDRRVTVRDITESNIRQTVTITLGFEKVCGRWVPRLLSADKKQRRISASTIETQGDSFLSRIISLISTRFAEAGYLD